MNSGSCLCGDVSWETSGEPVSVYHCHCSMCRKAHGSAFGTYAFYPAESFNWTGESGTRQDYRSSTALVRSFCNRCGSVIPNYDDDGAHVFVPTGCQDDGPQADCHIFAASKAPWIEIRDDLPCHPGFAPGLDLNEFPDRQMEPGEPGKVRGSCLCNAVEFTVNEPLKVVYNCHCRRCRRARSAVFATNGFTSFDGLQILKGEARMAQYKLPEATYFTQVFCDICGSTLPRKDPGRNISVIPLGALDEDPGRKPGSHIFTAYKAGWYPITDGVPCFEEEPS